MTVIQRDNIIELAEKYNNTDKKIIKDNMLKYIRISQYKRDSQGLADKLGVSLQTVYSYRKLNKGNTPDFATAIKLTKELNITINDLMEGKNEI